MKVVPNMGPQSQTEKATKGGSYFPAASASTFTGRYAAGRTSAGAGWPRFGNPQIRSLGALQTSWIDRQRRRYQYESENLRWLLLTAGK
jgi:hypothetical protein